MQKLTENVWQNFQKMAEMFDRTRRKCLTELAENVWQNLQKLTENVLQNLQKWQKLFYRTCRKYLKMFDRTCRKWQKMFYRTCRNDRKCFTELAEMTELWLQSDASKLKKKKLKMNDVRPLNLRPSTIGCLIRYAASVLTKWSVNFSDINFRCEAQQVTPPSVPFLGTTSSAVSKSY